MNTYSSIQLPWRGFSRWSGLIVATVGAATLAAWAVGLETRLRSSLDAAVIGPSAAIGLLLLGAAIYSCHKDEGAEGSPWLGRRKPTDIASALAIGSATIGLVAGILRASGADLSIDDFISGGSQRVAEARATGPEPWTTAAASLLAVSLLLVRSGGIWRTQTGQALVAVVVAGAYFVVLANLYEAQSALGSDLRTSSTLPIALILMLTGLAILSVRPRAGYMRFITGEQIGSRMALRLVPTIALAVPLVALGRVLGTRAGLFDYRLGTAIVVTVVMVGSSALIVWIARGLNRAHARADYALADERRASTLLSGLVRHADAMIAVGDTRGRLLLANPTFERWVGRPFGEMLGRNLADVIPFEIASRRRSVLDRVLRSGIAEIEETRVKLGDVWIEAESRTFPIRDEDGRNLAVGVIVVDVTERKLEEEAIERLRVQLERESERVHEAIAELDAFAHTISHDLRSPLRAIDGFAQVVSAEYGSAIGERGRHFLERIRAGVREMHKLIVDLLEYSRAGRADLDITTLDMSAIARRCNDDLAPEREGRHVRVSIGELPRARGDQEMIEIVFAHLLSNAHKYTRTREIAEIEIGAISARADGPVTYYVRDNGIGLDARLAERVFEPFERLHRSGDYGGGSGVGLATVRRIVQRHGGSVWLHTEPDLGTTIYFQLRRVGVDAAGSDRAGTSREEVDARGRSPASGDSRARGGG